MTETKEEEEPRELAYKKISSVIPVHYFDVRKLESFLPLYAALNKWFKPVVEKANGKELKEIIILMQPLLKTEDEVDKFYGWLKDKPTNDKMRILLELWHY